MNRQALEEAIRNSWLIRQRQADKQAAVGKVDAGSRGSVTGGAHLDALTELIRDAFIEQGFSSDAVRYRTGIEIPGYYRATKKWDLVVVDRQRLVAAVELKSHIGPSFGNNFNNRTEEALGNAVDVWRAYEAGAFGAIRPWLGYVLLLEEAPGSVRRSSPRQGVFPVDPVFDNTSYQDRYAIFCQRLVRERLYDAACLLTSTREPDSPVREPETEVGFANFAAAIAGRSAYIRALDN